MKSRITVSALALASALIAPQLALAQSAPAPAAAPAPTPEHSFTYNVGLVTDYRYRGISQSGLNPALQGGVDYAHSSGFYLGAWASTITWLTDANLKGRLEVDLYGGYKGTAGPISYDVGLLQYWYPGNNANPDANTLEVYGAGTYGAFTAKYSHSLTNLFGTANSKGSGYLDLSATFDLGNGWGVVPHIGRQRVANNGVFTYTDASVTVTKEAYGLVFSGMLVGTDTSKAVFTNANGKYLGKTAIVLGVKKNF